MSRFVHTLDRKVEASSLVCLGLMALGGCSYGPGPGSRERGGQVDRSFSLRGATQTSQRCDAITNHHPITYYLSADDSNSVASPVIARRLLRSGSHVPPGIVRTHEFMNYYNPVFAPAKRGLVDLHGALRPSENHQTWTLQTAIQSEARTVAQMRPMTLTFVLDDSGSMASDQRMDRQKAVIRAIAAQLREGDIVSVTTWNVNQRTLLSGHRVTGPNDPTLLASIAQLSASGGTDLDGGLAAGYTLARQHFAENRLNRVILISDGEANMGVTSGQIIGNAAHKAEGEEIYLVGVGVGNGVGDSLMDAVTDAGRGAYIFIDSVEEAAIMFGRRFVENMDIAVRSVRLELQLPWYFSVQSTSAETISRNRQQVDPQHLAPNDAMVFQQQLVPCGRDVVSPLSTVTMRATFEDLHTRSSRSVELSQTIEALSNISTRELYRGQAIVAYAELLKTARGPVDMRQVALRQARAAIARARQQQDDAQLTEISQLVELFAQYPNR